MIFYSRDGTRYVVDLEKLAAGRSDFIISKDEEKNKDLFKKTVCIKPLAMGNEALSDIMILDIAKSVGIDMSKELYLLPLVYQIIDTIKNENLLKHWDYRVTLEGNKYWYNIEDKRSTNNFPYKDDVKKYIKIIRKEVLKNAKGSIKLFSDRNSNLTKKAENFLKSVKKKRLVLLNA